VTDTARAILITGVGHSGTRLVVQMLARHPHVSAPSQILNAVQEYTPLHQFFIKSMDLTPISAEEYAIDASDLAFVLDSYMLAVDQSNECFVIKMPYYPLNCLEIFLDYFAGNISLVYTKRPKEKIVKSYLRRGQDRYFWDPVEHIRQVKKLGLEDRKQYLAIKDPEGFFGDLVTHSEAKCSKWNQSNPQHRLIELDIEQFSTSRQYVSGILHQLGLSAEPIDEMLAVVNVDRLLKGKSRIRLRWLLRRTLPESMWNFVVRLRERIRD
jgi:hypothetical protein